MSTLSKQVDDFFREHPGGGTRITLTQAQWHELRAQLEPDGRARRERIAAQIMLGIFAGWEGGTGPGRIYDMEEIAADALAAADALIKAVEGIQ